LATWLWIVVALVILVVLAVAAWTILRGRRRQRLRQRFGPEYDRTVAEAGKPRRAEAELEEREKRRAELDIRPLAPAARDRYSDSWRSVQERFVDEPSSAVADADRLVSEVMRDRGYPVDDFEQRAADVSVDHPHVVDHYRAAHAVYVKDTREGAGTEELRQAFVHYRALFEDLLVARGDEQSAEPADRVEAREDLASPISPQRETAVEEDENGGEERPVVREETRIRKLEDEPLQQRSPPGATTKRGPASRE
jgi:hypothetical protein